MDRQEILYFILGLAVGSLLTSIFLLRAPLVSQKAYDLGLRMKSQTSAPKDLEKSGNMDSLRY